MNNHVILCGLGELGFRTLERLRAFGEEVVVLDPRPSEDFRTLLAEWKVKLVQDEGRNPRGLREAGHAESAIARVRSPVGLIPQARDASVLALSVLAEVVGAYEALHPHQ